MSSSFIWGVAVGLVVTLVIAALVALIFRKSGAMCHDYDERQQAARGRAFRTAYFTLAVLIIANGLYVLATDRPWCDGFTAAFIPLCASAAVFAIQCIMRDAYLSVSSRPKSTLVLFSLVGALNIGLGLMNLVQGRILSDNLVTFRSANLVCGAMFIAIIPALLIRVSQQKRADDKSGDAR